MSLRRQPAKPRQPMTTAAPKGTPSPMRREPLHFDIRPVNNGSKDAPHPAITKIHIAGLALTQCTRQQ